MQTLKTQSFAASVRINCMSVKHQVKMPCQQALSSSFMGHAQQLRLKLRDHDLTLLAQVNHLQDIQPSEQVYVSVDLNNCYFLAADEHSTTTSSSTHTAVQV